MKRFFLVISSFLFAVVLSASASVYTTDPASQATQQEAKEGYNYTAPLFSLYTYTPPSYEIRVGTFAPGEGCISGFKRLGVTLSTADCLRAARALKLRTMVYIAPDGHRTYYVLMNPGDPFAVKIEYTTRKVQAIVLYREGANIYKDGVPVNATALPWSGE